MAFTGGYDIHEVTILGKNRLGTVSVQGVITVREKADKVDDARELAVGEAKRHTFPFLKALDLVHFEVVDSRAHSMPPIPNLMG